MSKISRIAILGVFTFTLGSCGGSDSSSASSQSTQASGITTPSQVNVVTPTN